MGALLIMMLSISTASGCGRTTQQADTTGAQVILVPATDTIEAPEAPEQATDNPPAEPPPPPEPEQARPPRQDERKKRRAWIPEPLTPQRFLGSVAPGPGTGWRR